MNLDNSLEWPNICIPRITWGKCYVAFGGWEMAAGEKELLLVAVRFGGLRC